MTDIQIHESATFNEKTLVIDEGQNNRIILHQRARIGIGGATVKLEFKGSNNLIELYDWSYLKRGDYRCVGDGNRIIFGKKTTVNKAGFLAEDGSRITLGEDCMLSYDIQVRTTDAHSIYDTITGELKNPPEDVTLGDRCWIGRDVCIQQGVTLANDTIVGTRALVTKPFLQPNTAIAGIPARIVSENVRWKRNPPKRAMRHAAE